MKIIGLTGSIATGKTFVADYLAKQNFKVFLADLEVSKLLQTEQVINSLNKDEVLSSSINNGEIDKAILSKIVFSNEEHLVKLENIIHPFVDSKIKDFIEQNSQEELIFLEIPLLFEKGYQQLCDKVITTHCEPEIQRQRALSRFNLDDERLAFILKKQMSIKDKALLTDFIVYTDITNEHSIKQVDEILKCLKEK
jgi:dephospho-CoA kinase